MKNKPTRTAVLVALMVWTTSGFAQTTTPPNATNAATPPAIQEPTPPLPPTLPILDPAKEIKGIALVEALRKGGLVLYMRHAETGNVTQQCGTSNLSAIGEENARKVGAAIRDLKIPIGAVRSSEPCRTGDTARLLGLGTVETTEDLNPSAPREGFDIGAARSNRLNESPPKGTNTILVSHLHGSRKKEEWLHLEMGEIIVFRPLANARAEPIARIRVAGWADLKTATAADAAR